MSCVHRNLNKRLHTVDKPLHYFELVYLVTALVPSDTACFANSPGSKRRTAVWISLEVMVDLQVK